MMMRRRTDAFTLIELLVVIAIIAILAALLFPVFTQAREKARQAHCFSNLRNINMAFQQYSNDYDERVTPFEMWGGFTGCRGLRFVGGDVFEQWEAITEACDPYQRWASRIQPYMRNVEIFSDPSGGTDDIEYHAWFVGAGCKGAVRRDVRMAWCWPWEPVFEGIIFSYGYNQLVAAHCGNAGSIAKISRPADICLIADASHKDAVPEQVVFRGFGWAYPEHIAATRIIWSNICAAYCWHAARIPDNARHQHGSNIGFLDGHSKFYHHSTIWAESRKVTGLDQLHQFTMR